MKNRLFDYPNSVRIEGKDYAICTDFSIWIEIEQQLLKGERGCGEGLARVLALAYPILPDSLAEAIKGLMWFYSGGEVADGADKGASSAPAYDLKADFEYIRAGFLKEFGIDLMCTDMHWWQFRRLLACLGDNCRFSQIVAYRRTDTSKIKNRELRSFYERMKKRYRLPDIRTDEEKESDTARKLESLF